MSQGGYVNARDVLPPRLLALVQRYCSGVVYIPVPEPNRHRDEQIRELFQQGRPVEEIATHVGLSKRRVWQLIRSHESEPSSTPARQGDAAATVHVHGTGLRRNGHIE